MEKKWNRLLMDSANQRHQVEEVATNQNHPADSHLKSLHFENPLELLPSQGSEDATTSVWKSNKNKLKIAHAWMEFELKFIKHLMIQQTQQSDDAAIGLTKRHNCYTMISAAKQILMQKQAKNNKICRTSFSCSSSNSFSRSWKFIF